jgi:hypothetical protein
MVRTAVEPVRVHRPSAQERGREHDGHQPGKPGSWCAGSESPPGHATNMVEPSRAGNWPRSARPERMFGLTSASRAAPAAIDRGVGAIRRGQ